MSIIQRIQLFTAARRDRLLSPKIKQFRTPQKLPDVDTLFNLYHHQKLTQQQIAQKYNATQKNVSKVLRRHPQYNKIKRGGLPIKPKLKQSSTPQKLPDADTLFDLYHNKKMSQTQIAQKYNASQVSVSRIIRRHPQYIKLYGNR